MYGPDWKHNHQRLTGNCLSRHVGAQRREAESLLSPLYSRLRGAQPQYLPLLLLLQLISITFTPQPTPGRRPGRWRHADTTPQRLGTQLQRATTRANTMQFSGGGEWLDTAYNAISRKSSWTRAGSAKPFVGVTGARHAQSPPPSPDSPGNHPQSVITLVTRSSGNLQRTRQTQHRPLLRTADLHNTPKWKLKFHRKDTASLVFFFGGEEVRERAAWLI